VFHPVDRFTVELLLNGDGVMAVVEAAVPVLLARRNPCFLHILSNEIAAATLTKGESCHQVLFLLFRIFARQRGGVFLHSFFVVAAHAGT
jgi:hypothetical protein